MALNAAISVSEDGNATQEAVDAAYTNLKNAIAGLTVKAPVTDEVNKTELNNVIASTEKLKEADYTPESWKAFRLALDLANAVNVNADATQEEVDAAKAELEKAVQGLVKVLLVLNKNQNRNLNKNQHKNQLKNLAKTTEQIQEHAHI